VTEKLVLSSTVAATVGGASQAAITAQRRHPLATRPRTAPRAPNGATNLCISYLTFA
jgi:hypothetical protein